MTERVLTLGLKEPVMKEGEPQRTMGFLGPVGTFTQEMAVSEKERRGEDIVLREYKTIADIFMAVDQGEIDCGVVPLINTTDGHIGDTMRGFLEHTCIRIEGEETSRIRLYSYQRPDANPLTAVSKDTALRQCENTLGDLLPNCQGRLPVASTALGVQMAADDSSLVGIGSERAAELLGIADRLIRSPESIEDNPNNATTFVVITKSSEKKPLTGKDKTSFIMNIPNQPGELYKVLDQLATKGVNLNKIKSLSKNDGHISFFISIDGHEDEEEIHEALLALEKTVSIRRLGSYSRNEYTPGTPPTTPNIRNAAERIRREVENGDGGGKNEKVIIFTLLDRPGALRDALRPFADASVNLTRIDSQPSGNYEEIIFYLAYDPNSVENEEILLRDLKNSCTQVYELNGNKLLELVIVED